MPGSPSTATHRLDARPSGPLLDFSEGRVRGGLLPVGRRAVASAEHARTDAPPVRAPTAAALLTLTTCDDDGSGSASATSSAPVAPAPATTSAAPASSAASPASSAPAAASAPAVGSVPSPNVAQTAGLTAALKAVDPALAADQAKAIGKALGVCQEIKAGKDDTTLANNAAQRFSGGSVTLTPEQGAVIVAAVKASFCP